MSLKLHAYLSGSCVALLALVLAPVSAHATSATAERLTSKQVKELTTTATTASDHLKLARYFEAKADRLAAEAQKHAHTAEQYIQTQVLASDEHTPTNYYVEQAEHCSHLAKKLSQEAVVARTAAQNHEREAEQASK